VKLADAWRSIQNPGEVEADNTQGVAVMTREQIEFFA